MNKLLVAAILAALAGASTAPAFAQDRSWTRDGERGVYSGADHDQNRAGQRHPGQERPGGRDDDDHDHDRDRDHDSDRHDGRRDDDRSRWDRDGRHDDRQGHWNGRDGRNGHDDQRNRRTGGWTSGGQDYRDYRRHGQDGRFWAQHRYRASSRYAYPSGYRAYSWNVGHRLPSSYYSRPYYIDYRQYRLPPPPYGYQWVRVDNDVMLVAVGSGLIREILQGLFY